MLTPLRKKVSRSERLRQIFAQAGGRVSKEIVVRRYLQEGHLSRFERDAFIESALKQQCVRAFKRKDPLTHLPFAIPTATPNVEGENAWVALEYSTLEDCVQNLALRYQQIDNDTESAVLFQRFIEDRFGWTAPADPAWYMTYTSRPEDDPEDSDDEDDAEGDGDC